MASFNPQRIGKFEIEDRMPEGGMSFVYRARHPNAELGLRAIKVLRPELATYGDFKSRFLEEARIGSQFDHENVVHIYDYGDGADEDVPPYMVMEFVDGCDLADYIVGGRTADLDEKLRMARQMAAALEHIHASGVFHRDVKPQNFIRRDADGRIKLIDFGIAKQQDAGIASSMTVAGTTVGTPSYMAPEQTPPAGELTPLVDVYAFGVVVFELMAGKEWTDQLPNRKNTPAPVAYRWIREQPLDLDVLRRLDPPVPEPICALIAGCTAKRPDDRFQSFREIASELDAMIFGFSSQTMLVSPGAPGIPAGSPRVASETRTGSPTAMGSATLPPTTPPTGGTKGVPYGLVGAVGVAVLLLIVVITFRDVIFTGAGPDDGNPGIDVIASNTGDTGGGPTPIDDANDGEVNVEPDPGPVDDSPDEGPNGGGTVPPDPDPGPGEDPPPDDLGNEADDNGGPTDPVVAPPGMVRIERPGGGAFFIDTTEVTNGMFSRFCESAARHPECSRLRFEEQAADFPVVNVTIDAARAYARWAGKRLPTASEWEAALRFSLGGSVSGPVRGNIAGDPASAGRPMAAGAIQGVGPLRDMIGNVWEMTSERRPPTEDTLRNYANPEFVDLIGRAPTADDPFYMMVGGSYQVRWEEIYPAGEDRFEYALFPEGFFLDAIGFRCVMDAG